MGNTLEKAAKIFGLKKSDFKDAQHKLEWYGDKEDGIFVVWEYIVLQSSSSRLCVALYPFNNAEILGSYTHKLNSTISVIRPFDSQQLVIKMDDVALTPKQFDCWIRAIALARRFRDAIDEGKVKRACPETGWLDGLAPTSKDEAVEEFVQFQKKAKK